MAMLIIMSKIFLSCFSNNKNVRSWPVKKDVLILMDITLVHMSHNTKTRGCISALPVSGMGLFNIC